MRTKFGSASPSVSSVACTSRALTAARTFSRHVRYAIASSRPGPMAYAARLSTPLRCSKYASHCSKAIAARWFRRWAAVRRSSAALASALVRLRSAHCSKATASSRRYSRPAALASSDVRSSPTAATCSAHAKKQPLRSPSVIRSIARRRTSSTRLLCPTTDAHEVNTCPSSRLAHLPTALVSASARLDCTSAFHPSKAVDVCRMYHERSTFWIRSIRSRSAVVADAILSSRSPARHSLTLSEISCSAGRIRLSTASRSAAVAASRAYPRHEAKAPKRSRPSCIA